MMKTYPRKIRVERSMWNSPAHGVGMFLHYAPGMRKEAGDFFTKLDDKTYVPAPVAVITIDFIKELDKRNIAFTIAASMKLHSPWRKAPFYYIAPAEGDGHPMTSYENTLNNIYNFFGQASGSLLDVYMKNIDTLPCNEQSFRALERLYKAAGSKVLAQYGIEPGSGHTDLLFSYWSDRFIKHQTDLPEVLKNKLFVRNGWVGA